MLNNIPLQESYSKLGFDKDRRNIHLNDITCTYEGSNPPMTSRCLFITINEKKGFLRKNMLILSISNNNLELFSFVLTSYMLRNLSVRQK